MSATLSQAKINTLTDEQLEQYRSYQKAQGVPEFMLATRKAPEKADKEEKTEAKAKPSAALASLVANGMTKTKVREQLSKVDAKLVINGVEHPLAVQDSSSGNIMLYTGGKVATAGFSGMLQISCSATAIKSGELPE